MVSILLRVLVGVAIGGIAGAVVGGIVYYIIKNKDELFDKIKTVLGIKKQKSKSAVEIFNARIKEKAEHSVTVDAFFEDLETGVTQHEEVVLEEVTLDDSFYEGQMIYNTV